MHNIRTHLCMVIQCFQHWPGIAVAHIGLAHHTLGIQYLDGRIASRRGRVFACLGCEGKGGGGSKYVGSGESGRIGRKGNVFIYHELVCISYHTPVSL